MNAKDATKRAFKVLIADDDVRMRAAIRTLVEDLAEEIFEAGDGLEALEVYLRHKPDWVTLDLAMSPVGGLTVLREIMARNPKTNVVVVTAYDVPAFREAARSANACGYVLKDDMSKIREVITGARAA